MAIERIVVHGERSRVRFDEHAAILHDTSTCCEMPRVCCFQDAIVNGEELRLVLPECAAIGDAMVERGHVGAEPLAILLVLVSLTMALSSPLVMMPGGF